MKTFRPIRYLTCAVYRLIAACFIITLLSAAASKIEANAPSTADNSKVTTVFLVRHAEKATTPPKDPPLTEAGKARSNELARILGQAGIKAIYTSQFLRTKQTAEPLAQKLRITTTELSIEADPSDSSMVSEKSIKAITDKIREQNGEAVLVVGHSNTVPAVIKMLGGDTVPVIDEKKEFDSLFVVTVYAEGKAKVVHLKYGSQN